MRKAGLFLILALGIAGLYLEQQPQYTSGFPWIVPLIDYILFFFIAGEAVVLFISAPYKKVYLKNHIPAMVFLSVYTLFFIINKMNVFLPEETSFGIYFFFLIVRNILIILKIYGRLKRFTGYLNSIFSKPAQTVVLSFVIVILVGTLLLLLPFMSTTGHTRPIDALFTATSAVCVTGLIVVDTAVHYTAWGQAVIMILIQIGGLGIMLLSYFMVLVFRRSVSLKDRRVLSFMLNESDIKTISSSVKRIILLTFLIEGAGALLLFPVFLNSGLKPLVAVFYSVFHGISAFCNAGFALYSDSFMSFQGNYALNIIIALLIITGGISFIVLTDLFSGLKNLLKRKHIKLSINTRVVIKVSGLLTLIPMVVIYKLEHETVLYGASLAQQYITAFFQAVTLRTAGFNTIPFENLRNGTLMLMIGVMFIGGASGSTAGGIKVNTLGVVWAYVQTFRKERNQVLLYRQHIPHEQILQAFTVIVFGVLSVFIVTFILLITENAEPMQIIFESVSAFATVGLSTGITAGLSVVGKICITALMFFGRIGPLTLLTASSGREKASRISYPEATLLIG